MAGPDADPGLTDTYGEVQHRFEALGGYRLEAEAKIILGGLGFSPEGAHRPLAEFSGGWRMRAALARLLLLRPDLLLLDEPTNHLDLESLGWLENFLAAYEGSVVIVSHDRYFLNRMVTAIAELAGGSVTLYHGDYDHFLVEREARQALREAQARNQAKRVAEIERFIDRFRYKASKARQVQSRVKMLDRMERIETEAGARRIHFSFPQPPRTGRLVARLAGVRKAYGDNVVYSGVDFLVERGDRVALVGVNGAGKSTLLKVLAGALPFDAGERALGSHVEVQYYAQHQLDLLDPTRTVLEEIELAAPEAQTSRLRTILGSFLFSGDTVEKKVAVLSGGEKARLALAKMLARPAALLCMDEPTNHLDLASKEVLEEALSGFTGTIVFISHDRYFINRIATQVVEVDRGHLTTHLGTYDDYLDHKAAATASPAAAEPTRSPAPKPASKDQTTARQSRASAAGGSAGAISGPPQMKGLKNETKDSTNPQEEPQEPRPRDQGHQGAARHRRGPDPRDGGPAAGDRARAGGSGSLSRRRPGAGHRPGAAGHRGARGVADEGVGGPVGAPVRGLRGGIVSDDRYVREVDDDTLRREKARARALRQTPWWRRRIASGRCHYCQRDVGAKALTLDHVVPLVRGGRSIRANLVAACKECNHKKQSLLAWEWQAYLDTLDRSADS